MTLPPFSRRAVIKQIAGSTLLGLLPAKAFAQAAAGKDLAAELAAAVPPGTSINVADQDDAVGVPWQLSGLGKDAPYKATIANFAGGTAVLEALI